jgi:hypothetical protein
LLETHNEPFQLSFAEEKSISNIHDKDNYCLDPKKFRLSSFCSSPSGSTMDPYTLAGQNDHKLMASFSQYEYDGELSRKPSDEFFENPFSFTEEEERFYKLLVNNFPIDVKQELYGDGPISKELLRTMVLSQTAMRKRTKIRKKFRKEVKDAFLRYYNLQKRSD